MIKLKRNANKMRTKEEIEMAIEYSRSISIGRIGRERIRILKWVLDDKKPERTKKPSEGFPGGVSGGDIKDKGKQPSIESKPERSCYEKEREKNRIMGTGQ